MTQDTYQEAFLRCILSAVDQFDRSLPANDLCDVETAYNGLVSEGQLNSSAADEGRFRWRSRTLLVLVPLHVAAFVALYLGTMAIVQKEIFRTQTHDARVTLEEAIHYLHPLMVAHEGFRTDNRLLDFISVHQLLDLKLYGPDGNLLGERLPGPNSTEIRSFLEGGEAERFRFFKHQNRLSLQGVVRLVAEGPCQECHPPGQLLGAASMRRDMTPELAATHNRMGRNMALLIVVWVVIIAALSTATTRMARKSVAKIEEKLSAEGGTPHGDGPGVDKIFLDPVAAHLYDSLRDVLEQQRKREAEVSSRLQHTERLASLGQLAAGLAHEIKNPLAGIRGVLELLRDESPEEANTQLYGEMLEELDRVNGTIHSLLRFARPAKPRRQHTDVAVLLESTAQLMRPALVKRSIELDVETSPDLPEFEIDPDQIRQVLVNLIGNAADAVGKDGTISIRAATFPDHEGLIIAVTDEGSGIPEKDLSKIFEPFHTTKFSGTGLGLAVARALVEHHGGRIEVESKIGIGSIFLVLLPNNGKSVVETPAAEA